MGLLFGTSAGCMVPNDRYMEFNVFWVTIVLMNLFDSTIRVSLVRKSILEYQQNVSQFCWLLKA